MKYFLKIEKKFSPKKVPSFNGALNWVMDAILKFCSFGWVSWAHNDFFIWQAQDARTFKWLAPAPPDQVRDIELKVRIFRIFGRNFRPTFTNQLFRLGGIVHDHEA